MTSVHVVMPSDPYRGKAEQFIREVYHDAYGAEVSEFANRLICRIGPNGATACVAGLRLAEDGFFSEQYLSEPVETALSRATGYQVARSDIYEVTTLASRSPREISAFIDDIISFGARSGLSWSFFTLTQRLRLLVQRRSLSPIFLSDAEPSRLSNPLAWGRYYESRPRVYGVCGIQLLGKLAPPLAEGRYARVL